MKMFRIILSIILCIGAINLFNPAFATADEDSKTGANVKVLFSPKGGISKELLGMYKAAKTDIKIAVFSFTTKYQARGLIAAQKRGVKVQVLLDKKNAERGSSLGPYLAREGITVRYYSAPGGSMHHKFIIVDDKNLATGSYNLSNDAEFRNSESMLFTSNTKLVSDFKAEFDQLWKAGREG
jgi:phosphatidylserine/phosphatidylglycerophosphate/cardiolipin synthase-like enzyme